MYMDCIIRHGILYNRQQRVQNPATKVKKNEVIYEYDRAE